MKNIIYFIKVNLRGIGQIMLQNSSFAGLLFLFGIFLDSSVMGLGAILGVLVGTLSSFLLKYDKKDIVDGLYGYNSVLVGIALTFYFKFNLINIFFIIIFSIFSVLIMNFMHKKNLYPFTFPFVLSTWIGFYFINYFSILEKNVISFLNFDKLDVLSSVSMSFGQVMFQGNITTGILFIIGVFISSRIAGIYGLIGSIVSLFTRLILGLPLNSLNIGLFSYSAVLSSIALSDAKKYSLIYVVLASIISVIICIIFLNLNILILTTPFVFATWIMIFLKNKVFNRNKL